MAYVLRPAKTPKPGPWTPDGKSYIPAPIIDFKKIALDGGVVKWSGNSALDLAVIVGTTIIPFVPVEHLSERQTFYERMEELIAFFKDNEDELLDAAKRADTEQADHEEKMKEWVDSQPKPKKR